MKNGLALQGLLLLTIMFSLGGALIAGDATAALGQKIALAEKSAPALPKIQITTLSASTCTDCFDLSEAIALAKGAGANVTEEKKIEFNSPEGKSLVAKYAVAKIPTIIITGETANASGLSSLGAKADDGAIVFDKQTPIYLDAQTGEARGRVEATLIGDSSCADCVNYAEVINQLTQAGIKISKTANVEYSDDEGRQIIAKYNITQVPTLLLSKDAKEYGVITQAWSNIGDIATDGTFVLRQNSAPYRDLQKDEIAGRVSVIYLSDDSCTECYNATVHTPILLRFGLKLAEEKNVSVQSAEGKQLVSKYNVTAVPTILVSPEASVYPAFLQVWEQVGSTERDGWLVFRNIAEAMQGAVYKNLTSGETIGLAPSPTPRPSAEATQSANATNSSN